MHCVQVCCFPKGIAVDGEGNFAAFDGAHRTVLELGGGCGAAFDSQGDLAVAVNSSHCAQVLRCSDGTHHCTIGSEGAGAGRFH